jgi:hypothetical protein
MNVVPTHSLKKDEKGKEEQDRTGSAEWNE